MTLISRFAGAPDFDAHRSDGPALSRSKIRTAGEGPKMPSTVAIIVPVLNEERNLGRLLESVRLQQDIRFTVAVVDQGSTDTTREIAHDYGCLVVSVTPRGFYSPPGAGRNIGAAAVPGDLLLNLDADMELGSPDFLKRLVALIDEEHQAVVIHEIDKAEGFWGRCKALERRCYWGSEMESPRALSRKLFDAIGGYDTDVSSGEDFNLSMRCHKATGVVTSDELLIFHHTGRRTLRSLLVKKFHYGKTVRLYLRKARETAAFPASRVMYVALAAYVRNIDLVWSDSIHYLGIFPLRMMELLAIMLGMLAGRRTGSQVTARD